MADAVTLGGWGGARRTIAEHLGETSPTVDEPSNEEHDDTRPDSPESE